MSYSFTKQRRKKRTRTKCGGRSRTKRRRRTRTKGGGNSKRVAPAPEPLPGSPGSIIPYAYPSYPSPGHIPHSVGSTADRSSLSNPWDRTRWVPLGSSLGRSRVKPLSYIPKKKRGKK